MSSLLRLLNVLRSYALSTPFLASQTAPTLVELNAPHPTSSGNIKVHLPAVCIRSVYFISCSFSGTSRRRFPPMVLSALWQKLFWLIWITAPGLVAQLFLSHLKRLISYYGLHSVPSLPCVQHWWFVNLIFRLHNLLDKAVAIFFLTAVLYFCQFSSSYCPLSLSSLCRLFYLYRRYGSVTENSEKIWAIALSSYTG